MAVAVLAVGEAGWGRMGGSNTTVEAVGAWLLTGRRLADADAVQLPALPPAQA